MMSGYGVPSNSEIASQPPDFCVSFRLTFYRSTAPVNTLRRARFGDDDFTGGGSNRLVDALVSWGDEDTIKARLDEHRAAGANHVCIQVLSEEQPTPVMVYGQPVRLDGWRRLAPALTA